MLSKIIGYVLLCSFALFIILFIIHLVITSTHQLIKKSFKKCNVIVAGKKGSGKDCVFQWVIKKRSKDKYNHYWSNISYGYNYHHIKLSDISCSPNTFENFINNDVKQCKYCLYEKEDIYISDIGVYLPSQYDSLLHKKYPSLPIYYALSRHLAIHNVHCNVQNIERGWKALREQSDFFMITKKTIKVFGILFTSGILYDKYTSALNGLLPFKKSFFENKETKALRLQYESTNGTIKKFLIAQKVKNIKYNTRAFRDIVYADLPKLDRVLIHKQKYKQHKLFHKLQKKISRYHKRSGYFKSL